MSKKEKALECPLLCLALFLLCCDVAPNAPGDLKQVWQMQPKVSWKWASYQRLSWSAMASGNPPSYSRLFIHYILWLKRKPHFTSLTRIEQTLIWLPGALFIHSLVFTICIPVEQRNISFFALILRMCKCMSVRVCIFMFM